MPRGYYDGSLESGSRLAELAMMRGQAAQDRARQYGDFVSGAAQSITGPLMGLVQQTLAAREQRRAAQDEQIALSRRDQAIADTMANWDGSDPQQLFQGLVRVAGPKAGQELAQGMLSLRDLQVQQDQKAKDATVAENAEFRARESANLESLLKNFRGAQSADMQEFYYQAAAPTARQVLVSQGMDPDQAFSAIPENPSPDDLARLRQMASASGSLGQGYGEVKEGTALVDKGDPTNVITPNPKPTDPIDLEQQYADAVARGDQAGAQAALAAMQAQARAQQAPSQAKPEAGQIVDTPSGPMLVDRRTGKAVPVTGPGGEQIKSGQPSGSPKLPVSAAERVSGIEGSVKLIDELTQLGKDNDWSFLGPVTGRTWQLGQKVPGAPANEQFALFNAKTASLTNATIKAITGAQMSEAEAARIKAEIPLVSDKPEVWRAKAQATRSNLAYLRERIIALNTGQAAPPAPWESGNGGGRTNQQGEAAPDPLGIL